jgi:hypothetical protein
MGCAMALGMTVGLWLTYVARFPIMAAYCAGAIISLILVSRRKDAASWLALIGFLVLMAVTEATWMMDRRLFMWAPGEIYSLGGRYTHLNILLNLGSTAGVLCLAMALLLGLGQGHQAELTQNRAKGRS